MDSIGKFFKVVKYVMDVMGWILVIECIKNVIVKLIEGDLLYIIDEFLDGDF